MRTNDAGRRTFAPESPVHPGLRPLADVLPVVLDEEALDNELEVLEFAEFQRRHKNRAILQALRGANVPGLG